MNTPFPASPESKHPDMAHNEVDPMERVDLPRMSPWVVIVFLVMLGFGYIGLWRWFLRG